ncbi:MAG: class I SAM-dependent methyltransferase [Chloroflexota bacterium]
MNRPNLPPSEYDRTGDFYYNRLKKLLASPHFFFHENVDVMLRMLGDLNGRQVCDLACGEGYLARALAARGAHVTGIDLSKRLLAHARRQSPEANIAYLRDDARTLASVADASFDVVICNMALMDIPDLDATMKTVHRILKAGGTFVYCILHPCFETPFDAGNPPHELDDDGNVVAIRITRYRTEGKWYSDSSGIRGTLGSIHRMLSTYLNTLIQAGFTIAELQEPVLHLQEPQTLDQQLRSIAPRVLIVKAIAT